MPGVINLEACLERFAELSVGGYIFRGHSERSWDLMPAAFREHLIKEPHQEDMAIVYEIAKKHLFEDIYHPQWRIPLQRIAQIIRFLLPHGEKICRYVIENSEKFNPSEIELAITNRGIDFWCSPYAFPYFVQSFVPGIIRRDFSNGESIQTGVIINTTSAFDETHPQHYISGTTLLDWTYDFCVAIFFALRDITESTPAISIFALKHTPSKEKWILKSEGNAENNERLKAQKGCFTSFVEPIEFFLKEGTWPSIHDYHHLFREKEDLMRFDFYRKDFSFLQALLNANDINEQTLKLA